MRRAVTEVLLTTYIVIYLKKSSSLKTYQSREAWLIKLFFSAFFFINFGCKLIFFFIHEIGEYSARPLLMKTDQS